MRMLALSSMRPNRHPPLALVAILCSVVISIVFSACVSSQPSDEMHIVVISDGRQRAYVYDQQISVSDFLSQIDVDLSELDRIAPPSVTQIYDGMTITVVRVEEQIECEENPIPYQQRAIPNEGLGSGEERLAQPGVNGVEEVCYRLTYEDGNLIQRVEIQRVIVSDPQDEIVFVGIDSSDLATVPIEGALAYISHGNAWIMRGSSASKRPLTDDGQLDGRVFALSLDSRQLLFSRRYSGDEEEIYFNMLSVILDTNSREPEIHNLELLSNILYADWVPNQPYTFSYSTAEAREAAPGWQAYNDLWLMRVDDENAVPINIEGLIESSSGGVYGWWGTDFEWSPDGSALAWSRADSIGLVDFDTGTLSPLLDFPVYTTFQNWVWQPGLSWSPDGSLLVTTVHGQPFGSEQPENSPIFNIAVTTLDREDGFKTDIVEQVGIWASPKFSAFSGASDQFPVGYLAYLQARNPLNSINDEYDLVIADRDGSNARRLFPPAGQDGLEPQEIAWSPYGRHVALIYQGNLWIVEAETGRSQQLTVDGGATSPQWGS